MDPMYAIALAPAVVLLAALLNSLFGRQYSGDAGGILGTGASGLAFVLVLLTFIGFGGSAAEAVRLPLWDWLPGISFGFTVDQQYEREGKLRAVSLKAGSIRILLNQDDGGRGWDRTKGEGFSFQLTTAQSVDEIAQRIKANGGTLATEPADMPWGVRSFRLVDPDGYRLAISQPL